LVFLFIFMFHKLLLMNKLLVGLYLFPEFRVLSLEKLDLLAILRTNGLNVDVLKISIISWLFFSLNRFINKVFHVRSWNIEALWQICRVDTWISDRNLGWISWESAFNLFHFFKSIIHLRKNAILLFIIFIFFLHLSLIFLLFSRFFYCLLILGWNFFARYFAL
jgi:hypothetical protein